MGFFSALLKELFITPESIGKQGENLTASKLGWVNLWGYHGMMLQNVYIPKRNGETTEIDLLYITEKGIFVIESKNYSGYIFGSETNRSWTSTYYAGKTWLGQRKVEKHHFYNPVWQNETHIKYLRKFLTNTYIPMYSLIVFSNHCEFKDITITSPNVYVCYRSGMNRCIKDIWRNCHENIPQETIEKIYNKLSPLTEKDEAAKQIHINNIESKLNSIETCPWCGSKLVLRTARNGKYSGTQFYGCSNYPKCKYIKNI